MTKDQQDSPESGGKFEERVEGWRISHNSQRTISDAQPGFETHTSNQNPSFQITGAVLQWHEKPHRATLNRIKERITGGGKKTVLNT